MYKHYVKKAAIRVNPVLLQAVESEILPNSGISSDKFWSGLSAFLVQFEAKNAALLRKRDAIQAQIDAYCLERKGKSWVRR